MTDSLITCPSCGVKTPAESLFCTHCGSDLNDHLSPTLEEGAGRNQKKTVQTGFSNRSKQLYFAVSLTLLSVFTAFGWDSFQRGSKAFGLSGAAGAGAQPNSPTQNPSVNSRSTAAPQPVLPPQSVEIITTLEKEILSTTDNTKKRALLLTISDEYLKNNRLDLAAAFAEKASEVDPTDLALMLRTANLYDDAGLFHLAMPFYERVLARDEKNTDARVDFAICLLSMGNLEGGKTEMERAVRDNPSHQKANLNVGIIYLQLNDRTNAVSYWKKALAMNPNNDAGKRAKELLDTYPQ